MGLRVEGIENILNPLTNSGQEWGRAMQNMPWAIVPDSVHAFLLSTPTNNEASAAAQPAETLLHI